MPRAPFTIPVALALTLVVASGLVACAPRGPVTLRPITGADRRVRPNYLWPDATAIAEINTRREGTLVVTRRTCDRIDAAVCAFDVIRLDGTREQDLGSFTGTTIVADGWDVDGWPVLVVDGDRCLLLPASDPAGFRYTNDRYVRTMSRAEPLPPISHAVPASREAIVRGDLRTRYRPGRYYSEPLSIFDGGRRATLVAGEGDEPYFAVFAGPPNALGALLLEHVGAISLAPTRTNGASDLVVRRFQQEPLLFRYDGTRYEPAACQDGRAVDPTGTKV